MEVLFCNCLYTKVVLNIYCHSPELYELNTSQACSRQHELLVNTQLAHQPFQCMTQLLFHTLSTCKVCQDCLPQILLGPFLNTLTHITLAMSQ